MISNAPTERIILRTRIPMLPRATIITREEYEREINLRKLKEAWMSPAQVVEMRAACRREGRSERA